MDNNIYILFDFMSRLFPFLSALNINLVKNNSQIDTKEYFYSLQIIYFFQ